MLVVDMPSIMPVTHTRPPYDSTKSAPTDFVARVGAAFDQHVGADGFEQSVRRIVFEHDDLAHAGQRRQHGRAVALADDRPAGTLEPSHAGVAVDADEQRVAQRRGFGQVLHVADVEQIEAAVGEHHAFAAPPALRGRQAGLPGVGDFAPHASLGGQQFGGDLVAKDHCHTGPLDFQAGCRVGQTHGIGRVAAGGQAESDHGHDHVAGAGDVVDVARLRGEHLAAAVAPRQHHAVAVERDQRHFGVQVMAEQPAGG